MRQKTKNKKTTEPDLKRVMLRLARGILGRGQVYPGQSAARVRLSVRPLAPPLPPGSDSGGRTSLLGWYPSLKQELLTAEPRPTAVEIARKNESRIVDSDRVHSKVRHRTCHSVDPPGRMSLGPGERPPPSRGGMPVTNHPFSREHSKRIGDPHEPRSEALFVCG